VEYVLRTLEHANIDPVRSVCPEYRHYFARDHTLRLKI
jgi:trimethylamine:corrinoid methyltransferase-like protein